MLAGGVWFRVVRAPMETLNQLDAAADFILPLSPTSPSQSASRNPPPPHSPLLIQLRTVSRMTDYGEQLGDDVMGVQDRRASLAGVLAGGVWFCVVHATVIIPLRLMLMFLCCILLFLVDLMQVL